MKYSFFQDDIGNFSMNRLLAFIGGCMGSITACAGIVHLFVLNDNSASVEFVLIGLAVFTGSQILKNTGRKLENGK